MDAYLKEIQDFYLEHEITGNIEERVRSLNIEDDDDSQVSEEG